MYTFSIDPRRNSQSQHWQPIALLKSIARVVTINTFFIPRFSDPNGRAPC